MNIKLIIAISIALINQSCRNQPCSPKLSDYASLEKCSTDEKCIEDVEFISISHPSNTHKDFYFINSDVDYTSFKDDQDTNFPNHGIEYPVIDFSKKTLLGKVVSTTACGIATTSKLTEVSTTKRNWTIRVIKDSNCEKNVFKICWIVIPKINQSEDVQIIVKEEICTK